MIFAMEQAAVNLRYLQEHSLFGGVTREKIQAVIPLLEEVTFPAGTFILRQGDFEDRIYFLVEGSVEVLKHESTEPGREKRIALIPEGETFGEMEFIEPESCAATIRSLEPIRALTLSNSALYKIFQMDPETFTLIILNLARLIVRRMRKLQHIIMCGVPD